MIYLNDIIEMKQTVARYRIVYLNYEENEAWLYPLEGKNPMPLLTTASKLEQHEKDKKLKVIQGLDQEVHAKPTDAALKARDAAFESISPFLNTPAIFNPADRNRLLNARATELNCSPRTLLRSLRAYWAGGQTRNALLPHYHNRGSTKGATSRRGRPPKYEDRPIYQVTDSDISTIKKAIESLYLKGKTATIVGTYEAMVRKSYSVVDTEGVVQPKAPGEFPTVEQFRRLFKQLYSSETVIRSRKGNAEFELNHASKLQDAELSTYTVGDSFEIDATIADVLLVFSQNRSLIVGKPTLYFVIDSKTWLIVGFYVGFEHPSWPAAIQSIVSIAEDKEALCKRYGVPYHAEDWPAHGVLPKEFTADRGELISKESTRLVDGLEVTIKNLPAKMAKRKPHVECSFKLIQRPMAEHVPGYVPPESFGKRQGKHYDKDACLTLDEFTTIILRAIIRFNTSPRPDYPLTPSQTLKGLIPTPINLWNDEIRSRAGYLPRYSSQFIRNALLPRDEATVTREGIRLGDCYYSCNEAVQRGWFNRAAHGAFKVTVSYDRRLADEILVHDDKQPGKVFVASLLEKCSHYRGMSFQEIEAIVFERTRIQQQGRRISRTQSFEFHAAIDPITKDALAEAKRASKGKSRTSRKKDIREQRTIELSQERREKAALSPPRTQKTTAEILPLAKPTPTPTGEQSKVGQRNSRLLDRLNANK